MNSPITKSNPIPNPLQQNITPYSSLSVRVEDIMVALGLGRSAAYNFVKAAEVSGQPFRVYRIGNSLLIPKKSFDDFLQSAGFM